MSSHHISHVSYVVSHRSTYGSPIIYRGSGSYSGRYRPGTIVSNYRPRYFQGGHRPRYESGLWGGEVYPSLRVDQDSERKPDKIQPVSVDFNERNNKHEHHTERYDSNDLVVRRGQEFKVTVTLDNPIRAGTDKIKLQFAVGDTPQESKGTLIRLNVSEKLNPTSWSLVKESEREVSGNTEMTFKVLPSPDAIIGKYTMFVETWMKGDNEIMSHHRHKCKKSFILLFNPWCKDDAVFLEKEAEREEYVMNDYGRVYVGQKKKIYGRPWYFGQFEGVVLDAALELLKKCYLGLPAHSNPTLVARALSALANANDADGGVLVGNWSGDYTGGRSPTAWNGSVAILEEYMATKRSVKFGQCWVFSGLITTLCRTVGIPSRSVTNFDSAHDTDFSMTIDHHVDCEGRPMKNMDDSVWNFHVWNEVWLKRPDLPDGNDGWQAIDATPQEASDKMMRCGPAPLTAIKSGNVFLGYDTKFVFAEVNGDRVTWMVDEFDDMVAQSVSRSSVGRSISTKAVGSNERADITSLYKHEEGSEAEREAVKKASLYSSRKEKLDAVYRMKERQDVEFSFTGDMAANGDVTFVLSANNTSSEARDIELCMYATAVYYTGVPGEELGHNQTSFQLAPGESTHKSWKREAKNYFNLLDEDATIGVYLMAKVKQTGQVFTERENFWVDKPDLEVETPSDRMKVGQEVKVKVKFVNPVDVTLTGIELTVEGPGLKKDMRVPIHRSLKPNEEMVEVVPFTPKYSGKRELIVTFRSKQLTGVHGVTSLQID